MVQHRLFISASRRTDLPAWYSDWLVNRLRAGFCEVANPFNAKQVSRVSLLPADVRTLFLWTRWPVPLLPHLDEIERLGHRTIFLVTLTGLPAALEPFPHSPESRLEAIRRLAVRIGPERVWWRYDPIILGDRLDAAWHTDNFSRLVAALCGSTRRVHLSLLDWYRKTERRLEPVLAQTGPLHHLEGAEPHVLDLVRRLGDLARRHGMDPCSCCEPWFEQAGVAAGSCIDGPAAGRLFGFDCPPGGDPGQRPHCRCSPSFDIGANHTCISGCLYCYATSSHESALRRHAAHDPMAERV
jgi:DNA repair photolyase